MCDGYSRLALVSACRAVFLFLVIRAAQGLPVLWQTCMGVPRCASWSLFALQTEGKEPAVRGCDSFCAEDAGAKCAGRQEQRVRTNGSDGLDLRLNSDFCIPYCVPLSSVASLLCRFCFIYNSCRLEPLVSSFLARHRLARFCWYVRRPLLLAAPCPVCVCVCLVFLRVSGCGLSSLL